MMGLLALSDGPAEQVLSRWPCVVYLHTWPLQAQEAEALSPCPIVGHVTLFL